jgi:recombination protein RecA
MARIKKDILENTKNIVDNDIEFYQDIKKEMNKQFKGTTFILSEDDAPCNITKFVSSGSKQLDTIISNNSEMGGFPVGRISMVVGEKSSGKSLIAIEAVKDTQRQGGIAIYGDLEGTLDKNFAKNLGVDIERMIYFHPNTIEEFFNGADKFIQIILEKTKDKKDKPIITLIWDSVVATKTEAEEDSDYGDKKYASQAGIIAPAIRKLNSKLGVANVCFLMLNQLRQNMNRANIYSPKFVIPGGEACQFYPSVILMLKRKSKLMIEDMIMGYETEALTQKNKVSGDGRSCIFNIYFNKGVEEVEAILDLLREKEKFTTVNRDNTSFVDENGKVVEFKNKEFETVFYEHKDYINKLVRESLVIDLSNPNIQVNKEKINNEFEDFYNDKQVDKKTGEVIEG